MAVSRNTRSLLALPDFPEFAQAVRYGVPGTHEKTHGTKLKLHVIGRTRRRWRERDSSTKNPYLSCIEAADHSAEDHELRGFGNLASKCSQPY